MICFHEMNQSGHAGTPVLSQTSHPVFLTGIAASGVFGRIIMKIQQICRTSQECPEHGRTGKTVIEGN
jgi:hypothetical protein